MMNIILEMIFLLPPVMNSENKRDVYLPNGKWVNLFSGEIIEGGKWLKNLEVPMDEMPVWVKYGAEVSQCARRKLIAQMIWILTKNIRIVFDESFKGIKNHKPEFYFRFLKWKLYPKCWV